MNNPFIKRQMELRKHIISGFSGILVSSDEVQKGEDDIELEKAHKDGDMHPNGKWVWVSSANGGKGDWRTINGRTHQKHTAAQGSSGSQGTSGGSNGTPKTEKPGQQAAKPKVDTTTIDDAEYKRMYAQAKSVDDESRSMGLGIINSNISKYKKDLEDTIAKRPGAKATIKQLQDKLTKFISQKKAAEDVIAELEKKGNSGGKLSAAEQKALDNVVDKGFKISRSSWNDVSKMSLEKTPKGNWRCYYDGKDTGNTIAGSLMSEATAKKLGMLKDDATQGSGTAKGVTQKHAIPTTVDEAFKQAKFDKAGITAKAHKEASLKYGKDDADNNRFETENAEYALKKALKSGDATQIETAANRYASKKTYQVEYNKALSAKKKERKNFIDSAGDNFTEDQVAEYLNKYVTEKDPRAVVRNTWSYSMGSIGSTSATIEVGQGKAKKFDRYSSPSWRPIGMIEYSVRNWGGGYSKIKIPVQSWSEIEKNLSDTENFTLYLYKHPKQ